MKIKISPSVLACNFGILGREILDMERAGAEMIHLDVMDGHFVPNISFGAPVIASVRGESAICFDTHLMISRPLEYIESFADAGADLITFHVESDDDTGAVIEKIRACGKKVGLSLKPNTPAEAVLPFLDRVDMILVMTVEPGFGGQKFMTGQMDKLRRIRQAATEQGIHLDIQVDGGIDTTTAGIVVRSGANVLVAGSSLYGQADYRTAVAELRAAGEAAL